MIINLKISFENKQKKLLPVIIIADVLHSSSCELMYCIKINNKIFCISEFAKLLGSNIKDLDDFIKNKLYHKFHECLSQN